MNQHVLWLMSGIKNYSGEYFDVVFCWWSGTFGIIQQDNEKGTAQNVLYDILLKNTGFYFVQMGCPHPNEQRY